jgi:hypothetical protein
MQLPANYVASYPASRTEYPPLRVAIVMQSNHANRYLHLDCEAQRIGIGDISGVLN